MKVVKKWSAAFAAFGLTLACAASLFFASCSNSSDNPIVLPVVGPAQINPALVPLTLEAIDAGAVVTFCNKAERAVTYKVNGSEAQTIASGETKAITLAAAGDKVAFYGNNSTYKAQSGQSNIACSAQCYIYGNIMSLISSSDYENSKKLVGSNTFWGLFQNNANIKNKDGEDLLLPATTLTEWCYNDMFNGCSSLAKAPALPATTLAEHCYCDMFNGCTSLTTAPALPATTLDGCCYSGMFAHCTSLATAPALPATSLPDHCYSNMFAHCTSLATAPALPATSLPDQCYSNMFWGCTSLATAPELPATTMAYKCYSSMFMECDNLTTAPALPATTLAANCYECMFYYCASLTTAPALPATSLAWECYLAMFENCSNLSSVTCLATDISANNCVNDWLKGVKSTGEFTKAASMTTWPTDSASGIPQGWTTKDYQP